MALLYFDCVVGGPWTGLRVPRPLPGQCCPERTLPALRVTLANSWENNLDCWYHPSDSITHLLRHQDVESGRGLLGSLAGHTREDTVVKSKPEFRLASCADTATWWTQWGLPRFSLPNYCFDLMGQDYFKPIFFSIPFIFSPWVSLAQWVKIATRSQFLLIKTNAQLTTWKLIPYFKIILARSSRIFTSLWEVLMLRYQCTW